MRKSVLIVDRSMSYALVLQKILEEEGFRAEVLSSAGKIEGLKKPHEYEAVFLDINEYALKGTPFIKGLKILWPDTRIILTSEKFFNDKPLLESAVKNGIYGCVQKPFDRDEVAAFVDGLNDRVKRKKRNLIIGFFLTAFIALLFMMFLTASSYSGELSGIPEYVRSPESLAKWLSSEFKYHLELADRWQTPRETIEKRSGDCEDFAVLASEILKDLGIPSRIVVVEFKGLKTAHAICVWKDKKGRYSFFSNKKLFRTGKKTIERAIQKYYPDWDNIIYTNFERRYLGSLRRDI